MAKPITEKYKNSTFETNKSPEQMTLNSSIESKPTFLTKVEQQIEDVKVTDSINHKPKCSFMNESKDDIPAPKTNKKAAPAEPTKSFTKPKPKPKVSATKKAVNAVKAKKPGVPKFSPRPQPEADDDLIKRLKTENDTLLKQVMSLTDRIDQKLLDHKRDNQPSSLFRPVPNERLKLKKEAMDDRMHKMKSVHKEIKSMYKALESNLNIDEIVSQENKLKSQAKKLHKQEVILKDTKRAIRGQNRFFKDKEKVDDKAGYNDTQIDDNYESAKIKYRELKEEYRDIDHEVKEQHEDIQTYKERARKVKFYITEKNKLECETGFKQTVSDQDIEDCKVNIGQLEEQKLKVYHKQKDKLSKQDDILHAVKKQFKAYKKRYRDHDKEMR